MLWQALEPTNSRGVSQWPEYRRASRHTNKIAEMLRGDFDKSALLRNAVRLIIEEALEAKVMNVLGRGYHERGEAAGYKPRLI